jgi:predicted amidohydrolase YtcJ
MDSLLITGGSAGGSRVLRGCVRSSSGDSIAAVGPEDDVRVRTPAGSKELRLSGESVLPGVTDGHLHLSTWAKQRTLLDLSSAKSLADALRMVRDEAGRLPPDRWVRGWNYNDHRWPEGRLVQIAATWSR